MVVVQLMADIRPRSSLSHCLVGPMCTRMFHSRVDVTGSWIASTSMAGISASTVGIASRN